MKKNKRLTDYWNESFDFFEDDWGNISKNKPSDLLQVVEKVASNLDERDDISSYRDNEKRTQRLRNETNLHIEHVETKSRISYVESYRVWEGTVMAVHEETFTARLEEQTGKRKARMVEIEKRLVNKRDWDQFFKAGFEFEWVFQRVNTNGTIKNRKEIRFTPIPNYLPNEIDELVKREMDTFSYLFEDDD